MKKWILLFCFLSSFAFAQDANIEIGERIYKTVVINGEEIKKWVVLDKFTQFNSEQRPVYEKSSNSGEVWWKYNGKGYIKSEEREEGITNFECDDEGRIIHSSWKLKIAPGNSGWTTRRDIWSEYHFKDDILYVHSLGRSTSADGTIEEYNTYEERMPDGKLIHSKGDTHEYWYKYDENGNMYQQIYCNNGDTTSYSIETEVKGNTTYIYTKASWVERMDEYNSSGLCVYQKEKLLGGQTSEYIYEYTYWDNGKIKTCSKYKL